MASDIPELLIAISLARASPAQRLRAAEVAFRYAAHAGIDTITVEPVFIETPPGGLAEAVRKWIKTGKCQPRRVAFEKPSHDAVAIALAASPYMQSINLVRDGRVLAGVSDAADDLDLEITRAEWDRIRAELESILGEGLRYDMAELAR